MVDLTKNYDALVIGGGNAALCAAITAREQGCSVLLLEHAPRHFRGGNSRHTRNLRCMHDEPTDVLTDAYHEDEYWDDLMRVTKGVTTESLARMTIRASAEVTPWMVERGVRFQPSLGGTLNLGRTNAFFLGGGKALVNGYFATAERLGIDILYDTEVRNLKIRDGVFQSADVISKGFPYTVTARNLVCASGGFQANLDWLKESWGPAADNFIIRGTSYNKGRMLRVLLDNGVTSVGDPKQCHAVAIDARAPQFDGGIVTRLDCVPFSIVVDRDAQRFYDEGEDFWPKRYAIWGRLVAAQPDQIAYAIIDAKCIKLFMPSVFPAIESDSIAGLAEKLGLDVAALEKTVADYNAAVQPGTFDNSILDNCATDGLTPPKTHWARKIEDGPFYAYPLRPGITFTYLGVKVDAEARMVMANDQPSENMFASGEIMAGNILGQGYLAGLGMTIGTVFGRIAGKEAAKNAKH
ncbi:FAD-dependent tricarballylate dehydrogenase TcuA [Thalassospira sp.]|uniref:FAD-dependent tricarballylate dehydrogenase TcuA n=1 Tax=Thalassospira sp. TaxID=1912094 RepID=UPI0027323908|nr:FAD-dependent tricarballylate dehydrogenase TcuA [Thalassospira sp.]MDP2699139.1 FAD-dependent tricarballylate dehydrogenase TcuA [Thalassospira sp.]